MKNEIGRGIVSLLLLLVVVLAGSASAAKYWIRVTAKATGAYTVAVDIRTNLPGSPTLSVSLGLNGQDPQDVFIGTGFQRVKVTNGRAKVTIDGSKASFPRNPSLPAGRYDVEVNFHPLWEENKSLAARLGIKASLEGTALVALRASGGNADATQKKAEQRRWVMLNVDMGDSLEDVNLEGRFGRYEVLPLDGGNPKILEMRYFPSIDMTFMVNKYYGTVEVWRMGRANR